MNFHAFALPVYSGQHSSLRVERERGQPPIYIVAEGWAAWDGESETDSTPQRVRLSPDEARRLAHALLYAADLMDAQHDISPTLAQ